MVANYFYTIGNRCWRLASPTSHDKIQLYTKLPSHYYFSHYCSCFIINYTYIPSYVAGV